MISDNEKLVVNELRKNSRERFKSIARTTGLNKLTVSSIYDRLLDKEIIKCRSILDNARMGLPVQASMIFRDRNADDDAYDFSSILMKNDLLDNVDHLHLLDADEGFMTETAFANMNEMHEFIDKMEDNGFECLKHYHIIDKILEEKFLI